MIQSYKQKFKTEDSYDTIVIGSGIGGLTTAAFLSKEGQKVLVLERHYTAGGFTHVFKRNGYEWDVGIHYIGEVQRPNSAIRRIFDYITDGKLQWADMGRVYDRIIIGKKEYKLVKGVENFKKQLYAYFPFEKKAINEYVDLVFSVVNSMGSFFSAKAISPILSRLFGGKMRKKYLGYASKTTDEVLRSITQNETLIKVLAGQYGNYGLPPKQSSFAMHATVVRHYFDGGSFPVGGSSEIVNTIDPVIEKASGGILINAEVNEILIEKNKAVGVQMKDGRKFFTKYIVSSAGIFNTYEKLIPKTIAKTYNLKKQLQKIKPSVAHACLYIGLKGSPESLQLPKNNLWIYPEKDDHDTIVDNYLKNPKAAFPVVYVSFPAAKDPSWSSRYPNRSTIDIITLLPFQVVEQWEGTQWMKRGKEYEKLKAEISDRLLEILYQQLPHLRGKIDHQELSTPLTTQNFVNYKRGEIYGIDHTPERFKQKFLEPRTPIKNLYLTGQDIVTAGIGGAMFSGVVTASAIKGKNLMKKPFKKRK
jgi:all-trans-retinol 13,14-reductase